MIATEVLVHGMTALAVLFLCGANIYAGIRNKNNATVLITKQALNLGAQTIMLETIKYIQIEMPSKK
jgi:hypothetical protein